MALMFSFGINGKQELLTLLKLKWSSHVLNANAFFLTVTIKQSDVVLLGYPLMMPMSKQVRRNDLEKYENVSMSFS